MVKICDSFYLYNHILSYNWVTLSISAIVVGSTITNSSILNYSINAIPHLWDLVWRVCSFHQYFAPLGLEKFESRRDGILVTKIWPHSKSRRDEISISLFNKKAFPEGKAFSKMQSQLVLLDDQTICR
jgi:hypothetical protein